MHHYYKFAPVLIILSAVGFISQASSFADPDNVSKTDDFKQESWILEQRTCTLVFPRESAPGNPWMWRTDSFEGISDCERALLRKGYHLAHINLTELYGNPKACALGNVFYEHLRKTYSLSPKPALMSAEDGALLAFNWASANPDKTACLYAHTPWLSLESPNDETINPAILTAYGLDSAEAAKDYASGARCHASDLGKARLPVYLIHPDSQEESRYMQELDCFYYDYRRAGQGEFERVRFKKTSDPRQDPILPILYFILKHTEQLPEAPLGMPIAQMPRWKVADFSGRASVRVLDEVLIIEKGGDMTGIVYAEEPPLNNYEITLEAMRLSGDDFFCGLTAPYKENVFSLIVGGWGGTCVGISSLDWLDAYNNETAQFRSFQKYRWHHIRLRVMDDTIQAWIDGEQMVNVHVAERDVDIRWEMAPTKPMGIATWRTTGAIRNFTIQSL
jgi:hypothetical protein